MKKPEVESPKIWWPDFDKEGFVEELRILNHNAFQAETFHENAQLNFDAARARLEEAARAMAETKRQIRNHVETALDRKVYV